MPGKLMLLLHKRSWLPVPRAFRADERHLAAALRYLPLLQSLLALVPVLLAWQLRLPLPLLAVLLLCLDLLLGGGVLLAELMWFGSGLAVEEAADGQAPAEPPRSLPAIFSGAVFLLLRWLTYWYVLRFGWQREYALLLMRALGGFCFVWLAYDFAARIPAKLHRGLHRADLLFAGGSLLFIAVFLSLWRADAALIVALLPGLLIAWGTAKMRTGRLGGLSADIYGAAAAAAETVFIFSYIVLQRFL